MAEYHLTRRALNAFHTNRTAKIKTCKTLCEALSHARLVHGRHGHVGITIRHGDMVGSVDSYGLLDNRVTMDLPAEWADRLISGIRNTEAL